MSFTNIVRHLVVGTGYAYGASSALVKSVGSAIQSVPTPTITTPLGLRVDQVKADFQAARAAYEESSADRSLTKIAESKVREELRKESTDMYAPLVAAYKDELEAEAHLREFSSQQPAPTSRTK